MATLCTSTSRPSCRSASAATTSLAAIRDHQVVIVAGETGSGKTHPAAEDLPRARPRRATGMIGHTQPRRIAARTVAERIAEELGTELGDVVGYQVRFTDRRRRRHAGSS